MTNKLLIVEDSPERRGYYEMKFGSKDYELLLAKNSEEALSFYVRHKDEIRVVVADLQLMGSEFNGLEVIKKIEADALTFGFKITFIAVTCLVPMEKLYKDAQAAVGIFSDLSCGLENFCQAVDKEMTS